MRAIFLNKTFLLLWLSHFYIDFCIGIWPIYKTLTHLDVVKAALILGISGFIGELSQVFFGFFSDRGHRKKILIFGLFSASAILFVTFAQGFTSLLIVMICLMIGSGSFHPAAVGLASQLFPQKGRSILFFTSGGALGLALSQIIFSQTLYWFKGHTYPLMLAMLFLAFLWKMHSSNLASSPKRLSIQEFTLPFIRYRRSLLLLYLAQVTSYGVVLCFIFMLPDLLRFKQAPQWLFLGGGHFIFILGSFLGMLLMGLFCDKWGYKKTLIGTVFCGVGALYTFLFLPASLLWTPILLALLGSSIYIINPLITSWGNQLIPESPSTVSALLMGLAWSVAHALPILGGILTTQFLHSPYLSALAIMALFLIFTLSFISFIPSTQTVEQSESSS